MADEKIYINAFISACISIFIPLFVWGNIDTLDYSPRLGSRDQVALILNLCLSIKHRWVDKSLFHTNFWF